MVVIEKLKNRVHRCVEEEEPMMEIDWSELK